MRLAMGLLMTATFIATADAASTAVTDFGSNPGALDMFEYVPSALPAGRPLVVVMHGCTQNAAGMEPAGWNALADEYQFAVVYPQQRSANQQLGCFDWFLDGDISRGGGEAESIIEMVDTEVAKHGIDRARVYVTGLSAGAAFTAVMLAAYPDRFRAGSIMSGIPYRCASDTSSGSTCASNGPMKTAQQWGDLVRAADPGFIGTYPRVQIWHGSMDYVVATSNATELVKQWTNVWGTDDTADAMDMISNSARTQYMAGSKVAVELYLVSGMGHAIATGSDPLGECPSTGGAFFADQKICSTLRSAQFFGLLGDGDPSDPGGDGSDGTGSGADPRGDGGFGGCSTGGRPGAAVLVALVLLVITRARGAASASSRPRS